MLSSLKEDLFSLRGGAAGVIVLSGFLAIIAIATTGWSTYQYNEDLQSVKGYSRMESGLWETCECKSRSGSGEW